MKENVLRLGLAAGAASAEHPDRKMNMLVPFGAGGGREVLPGVLFVGLSLWRSRPNQTKRSNNV